MANMIDQKPSFHGEAKVWEKINEYLPNDVIAYNNREINGREFDYCLLLEGMGALIIEVKGWLADKINYTYLVAQLFDQKRKQDFSCLHHRIRINRLSYNSSSY